MDKRILISGSTGLIGKRLVNSLCRKGALVKIISTNVRNTKNIFPDLYAIQAYDWEAFDNPKSLSKIIAETDIIINLAGKNIASKRWNESFKREMYDSRVGVTKLIVHAIKLATNKPELLVNASASGIYGFRDDETIDENAGLGDDFLAKLCRDWETEAFKAVQSGVRVVTIRTGIVLDRKEGALPELMKPFRFHLGIYLGNGRQWVPWIHIDDVSYLYEFVVNNTSISGAVNGCSPNPATEKELIKTLAEILKKKIVIGAPAPFLKIGIGEMANSLLTGQRCIPAKALAKGFEFRFPDLKDALANLLNDVKEE